MPVPRQLLNEIRQIIPPLNGTLHKGQSGRVGVLGGALEYVSQVVLLFPPKSLKELFGKVTQEHRSSHPSQHSASAPTSRMSSAPLPPLARSSRIHPTSSYTPYFAKTSEYQ